MWVIGATTKGWPHDLGIRELSFNCQVILTKGNRMNPASDEILAPPDLFIITHYINIVILFSPLSALIQVYSPL